MAALEKKLELILDAQARKAIMTSIDVGLVAVTGSTMISVLLGEELDCMRDLDLLYLDEIATKQLESCVIFKDEEDDDYSNNTRSGLIGRRGHTVSGGDEDSHIAVAVDMILAPTDYKSHVMAFDMSICKNYASGGTIFIHDVIGLMKQKAVMPVEQCMKRLTIGSELNMHDTFQNMIMRVEKYQKRGFDVEIKWPKNNDIGSLIGGKIEGTTLREKKFYMGSIHPIACGVTANCSCYIWCADVNDYLLGIKENCKLQHICGCDYHLKHERDACERMDTRLRTYYEKEWKELTDAWSMMMLVDSYQRELELDEIFEMARQDHYEDLEHEALLNTLIEDSNQQFDNNKRRRVEEK